MATFYIEDFINYNSFTNITSVSWEISEDDTFETLIDSTYKNKDAINGWFTRLSKPNNIGFYDENDHLHVRCKINIDTIGVESDSDWFTKDIFKDSITKIKLRRGSKIVGEIEKYSDGTYKTLW